MPLRAFYGTTWLWTFKVIGPGYATIYPLRHFGSKVPSKTRLGPKYGLKYPFQNSDRPNMPAIYIAIRGKSRFCGHMLKNGAYARGNRNNSRLTCLDTVYATIQPACNQVKLLMHRFPLLGRLLCGGETVQKIPNHVEGSLMLVLVSNSLLPSGLTSAIQC